MKWGLTDIEVVTDSITVHRWIDLTLSEEKRVKTKGAAEIIVKRRLGVLKCLVEELSLTLKVSVVPSKQNKADVLTRVKKNWLLSKDEGVSTVAAAVNLHDSHHAHHMGVDRSLYLARKVDPSATREDVKAVVKSCERCQRIDPAPITHKPGKLSVEGNWSRLAVNVTHYRGKCYLTMVDCGPGRYPIW